MTKLQVDTLASAARSDTSGIDHHFGGFVELDPESDRAQLCVFAMGPHTMELETANGTQEFDGFVVLLNGLGDSTRGIFECFDLAWNSDTQALSGGSRTWSASGLEMTVSWTNFTATWAPTDETAS